MNNLPMERAIFYNRWGGPEVLEFGELPERLVIDPDKVKLKRGYLLVRVRAISVNPVDWKILSGSQKLIARRRFPRIFGTDFSGEVYRTGKGCAFSGGDAVMGMVSPLTSGSGRQWLIVKASHCMVLPPGLAYGEGSSLPAAGISAIQACRPLLRKSPGRVLLIGAGGGVGSLVSQILAAYEWDITAVAREEQREILTSRGVSSFLNREGWRETIGSGWDAVVDCPGALIKNDPAQYLGRSGIYSPVYIPDPFIVSQIGRMLFWFAGPRRTNLFLAYPSKSRMAVLKDLIDRNILTPLVDSQFDAGQISRAVRRSVGGGVSGKITITIP